MKKAFPGRLTNGELARVLEQIRCDDLLTSGLIVAPLDHARSKEAIPRGSQVMRVNVVPHALKPGVGKLRFHTRLGRGSISGQ